MTGWVYEYVKKLNLSGHTLEVGSYDENGSVRDLFTDYIGVDIRAGKNVNIQMDGHKLEFPDEAFDNVLSLESLEHDEAFWVTVSEMKRVLKKGGVMVLTVPWFHFPPHEYPKDYWRFSDDGLRVLFVPLWVQKIERFQNSLMGHAVK